MRLLVTVVRGPGNVDQKAEFSQPGRYVFGCDRGVHFQLSAADPYVSGRHFQIEMDAHQCFLQDLGGPNKPRIDGRPVSRCEIQDQVAVQVGTTRLRFELIRAAAGPRCYQCSKPIEGVSTVSANDLKEAETADRAVYAHSECLTRDDHFGREFGEYLCYRRLGGGGFGGVFLGYETRTARVWAIKTALQSQGPDGLHRFRRKAMILQTLRHPNIVHCIGSGVQPDGTTYLVSEFVTGGDLHTLLHEKGALPLDRALPLMAPLLDALVYLQAPPRPTTHRDIKPAKRSAYTGPRREGHPGSEAGRFRFGEGLRGHCDASNAAGTDLWNDQIYGACTWYHTRIYSSAAGTIQFQINGAHPASITTAPTANMTPQFIVLQTGAAFEGLSIDWWAMKMQGLTR